MEVNAIATFNCKGYFIVVSKGQDGYWYVENNGRLTQSKLDDKEIVRYLAHAANDKL